MTPLLLAAVLLSQTPLTVVNTRRTGPSQSEGLSLARNVAALLDEAGIAVTLPATEAASRLDAMGTRDPAICQGKQACEQELARQLEVQVLVTVSVAKLGAELGIGLEALRTGDGVLLAAESLTLSTGAVLTADLLRTFAAKLRDALGLKSTAAPPPAALTPKPEASVPAPAVVAREEKSHALGVVLVTFAVLAAAAAVTLGIVAANADAMRLKPGSYEGSQAWASRTNTLLNGTVVAGGVTLLLGAGAVLAW